MTTMQWIPKQGLYELQIYLTEYYIYWWHMTKLGIQRNGQYL